MSWSEQGPRVPPCDRSALHVRLLRLFSSPSYRPPLLPRVALEVIALSRRQDVTFDEVAAVLEHDTVLAAKVLSLAQSAAHARRASILSLRAATVRLGLKAIRDLVMEAAVGLRVFRVPGYEPAMERLSRHSTATAYLMRSVCRRTAIEGEYAFLCGLLHDVGIAACLLALSDDARSGTVPFEAVGSVLAEAHEEASGVVTRLWGLPEEIQRVASTHHRLEACGPRAVNAALVVAEGLAADLGAGLHPGAPGAELGALPLDRSSPELFAAACEAIGLDEHEVAEARAEAAELVGRLFSPPPPLASAG